MSPRSLPVPLLLLACVLPLSAQSPRDPDYEAQRAALEQWQKEEAQRRAAQVHQETRRAPVRPNPYTRTITVERPPANGKGAAMRVEVYLYGWPVAPGQRLEARVIQDDVDGMASEYLELFNERYCLRVLAMEEWLRGDTPAAVSLRLTAALSPEITLDVSLFEENEFLRDVGTLSAHGYLEGLKQRHGQRLQPPNPWKYMAPDAPPIFQSPWSYVDYRIEGESPDAPGTRHRDWLIGLEDNRILILQLAAPEALFETALGQVQRMLRVAYVHQAPVQ